MAGLGAKGDHFASRRETTVLNGLQFNMQYFCLNTKVSCNVVGISFLWRMKWLCLSLTLDVSPSDLRGHLVYPLHHEAKKKWQWYDDVGSSFWCAATQVREALMFPFTVMSAAWHVFIWIGTQMFSSPVTAPLQMLFLSHISLLEQRAGIWGSSHFRMKPTTDNIKKHKSKMKLYWRRKLNTTSWPLTSGTWKRMMVLNAKRKCIRFSTLLLDRDAVNEGRRETQVSHALQKRWISLIVTTVNVFAEPSISTEQILHSW